MTADHRAALARLTAADWPHTPLSVAVITALGARRARFVGGAVRDTILGRPVEDIDVATTHTPDTVTQLLEAAGLTVIPTGQAYGTVTAVLNGAAIEVTTLRRDVATDGRRAVVAYTDNWEEDAARRDFTFNALYYGMDDTLLDPFEGLGDLVAGRVRFIGDAADRIREDYLRILRYFRFLATHGRLSSGGVMSDDTTLAKIRALSDGLSRLSPERVGGETVKLLSAPSCASVLSSMIGCGITLGGFLTPGGVRRVERVEAHERLCDAAPDAVVRLAALHTASGLTARHIQDLLRLSGAQGNRLASIAAALPDVKTRTPQSLRRSAYRRGRDATLAALLLQDEEDIADAYAGLVRWPVPTFPLRGRDLLDAGLKPGKALGAALRHAESVFVDSDFTASRDQLMRVALTHARGG